HVHTHGYCHWDVTPENILVTTLGIADYSLVPPRTGPDEKDVVALVKLADFGQALQDYGSGSGPCVTHGQWYHAPEVLLSSEHCSAPVDMWALGTVMAEVVNLRPLFPGFNEMDQFARIRELLGYPFGKTKSGTPGVITSWGSWPEGAELVKKQGYHFQEGLGGTQGSAHGVPANNAVIVSTLSVRPPQIRSCCTHDK
ncbi:Serine/threonine protein kinase, partial [Marasmius crinis-equi]